MRIILISLLVLSIFCSCERSNLFKYFSVTDIERIVIDTSKNSNSGYLFEISDSLYFLNQNLDSREIECYNLLTNKSRNLFEDDINKNITKSIFYQVFVKSFDSIYVLSLEKNLVSLIDSRGEVYREYQIPDSLTVAATPDLPLEIHGCNIHVGNTSKILNVIDSDNRKEYYQQIKPEIIISTLLQTSNSEFQLSGCFPDKYIESGNDFYDYFPTRCVNNDGQVLFSFNADHYIYVYDSTELSSKKKCRSRYIKSFNHIPGDKTFDMGYSRKFLMEEPKYERIYYDNHRGNYYRIVKHRAEMSEGKIEDVENFTWSIIVLDEDFNILGEQLFYFKDYNYQFFYPTKKGVYITKTNSDLEDKTIRLILFEV